MPSLISDILPDLKSYRLPGWSLGDGFICPYYSGYSLYNLPASICYWLKAPLDNAQTLKNDILGAPEGSRQHIILVVVDGMGLDWFLNYLDSPSNILGGASVWNDILHHAVIAPITSVVPSTTSTALTTLWTGRSPLEHGILGYELWLKEFGILSNMITLAPASCSGDFGSLSRAGFHAANFLPVPTLGKHLASHGIQSFAFIPQPITCSGLSAMHLAGTKIMRFRTLSDLWISLEKLIKTNLNTSSYTYVYYSDLDTLSHHYGPHDERVELEFSVFSHGLSRFIQRLRQLVQEDTLLLITADHGFISTPPNPDFELVNHPDLLKYLVMAPSGENGLPFIYFHPGQENKVRSYIDQVWEGTFHVMTVDQVLDLGLFGPMNLTTNNWERLGDMIVIPEKDAYWWWANKQNPLLGRHGGLSPQEMFVPLIVLDL